MSPIMLCEHIAEDERDSFVRHGYTCGSCDESYASIDGQKICPACGGGCSACVTEACEACGKRFHVGCIEGEYAVPEGDRLGQYCPHCAKYQEGYNAIQ